MLRTRPFGLVVADYVILIIDMQNKFTFKYISINSGVGEIKNPQNINVIAVFENYHIK